MEEQTFEWIFTLPGGKDNIINFLDRNSAIRGKYKNIEVTISKDSLGKVKVNPHNPDFENISHELSKILNS